MSRKPRFSVTRRTLPGLGQLPSAERINNQAPGYAGVPQATPGTPGTAGTPVVRTTPPITDIDQRMGYSDLLRENRDLQQGWRDSEDDGSFDKLLASLDNPWSLPSYTAPTAGASNVPVSGVPPTGTDIFGPLWGGAVTESGRPDPTKAVNQSLLTDDKLLRQDILSGNWSGTPAGGEYRSPELDRMKRMYAEATSAVGATEQMNEQDFTNILNGMKASFDSRIADWKTSRQQALDDGQAEVADRFAQQIADLEQQKADLARESANYSSVEQWFRQRIQQPYEDAKAAALAVDIAPVIAKQADAEARLASASAASDERLRGVLADLGMDTASIDNAMEADIADAAVLDAESSLLTAIGVRPGLLEQRKKFEYHLADQQRLGHMRNSAGEELVVNEKARQGIADADRKLGTIADLKKNAIDRVRRAVENAFKDGPTFPEEEEYIAAAVDQATAQLLGDLMPYERQAYVNTAIQLMQAGVDLDGTGVFEWMKNYSNAAEFLSPDGAGIFDEWVAGQQAAGTQFAGPEDAWSAFVSADGGARYKKAFQSTFDAEDLGIFEAIAGTYRSAADDWRLQQERLKSFGSSQGTGVYQNTDAQNIADAQAGVGDYGKRARYVAEMAPQIEQMFSGLLSSKGVQGANYFRPLDVIPTSGSTNSDHFTAGALDVFPKDQRTYDTKIRPVLDQMEKEGIIRYVVHMGQNDAHHDHVHISFAFPGVGDADFTAFNWDTRESG